MAAQKACDRQTGGALRMHDSCCSMQECDAQWHEWAEKHIMNHQTPKKYVYIKKMVYRTGVMACR